MAIIPRRHRSLIYKLLVAFPLAWIVIMMVLYRDKGEPEKTSEGVKAEPLVGDKPHIDSDELSNKVDTDDVIEKHKDVAVKPVKPKSSSDHNKEEIGPGVLVPPKDPDGPGEMGKPVKVENPDKDTKKKIDDGWQNNAFNQYVSDMISVHR